MDLFNAKALAAAQSRCAALERELSTIQGDLAAVKYAMRKQDELLFRLSQCTDFTQMRPIIAELCKSMEYRRKAESDRINSIIYTELAKGPIE